MKKIKHMLSAVIALVIIVRLSRFAGQSAEVLQYIGYGDVENLYLGFHLIIMIVLLIFAIYFVQCILRLIIDW